MRALRSLAVVVGLVTALACGACSSGGGNGPGPGSSGAKPLKGGTVVTALEIGQDVNWFNPILAAAACSGVNLRTTASMLYRPIVWVSPKITIDWAASMASAITPSDHGTKYSVTLKPYKWSDGTPVTSADVAAYYYLLKYGAKTDSCLYGLGGMPDQVAAFKVTSAQKFEVDYAPRSAGYNTQWVELNAFPGLTALPITQWLALCPGTGYNPANPSPAGAAKLWTCLNKEGANYKWPGWQTVSGPFKIDAADWQTGSRFTFVKNPGFSGHQASLAKIIMLAQASSTDTFAGLRSGSIDVGVVPANLAPQASSLTDFTTSTESIWAESRLSINLDAPPPIRQAFDDKQVRIALQEGIDTSSIINDVAHGAWYASYGPVPSRPDTYLSPQLKKPLYPFSLSKAKQTLTADGYSLKNKVMTKNGVPLKFTMIYPSGDATVLSTAELIQADWAKIGVSVSLSALSLTQLGAEIYDPTAAKKVQSFAAFPIGWEFFPDYYPTGETLYKCGGAVNSVFGFTCTKKLDQLIDATTSYSSSAAQSQSRLDAYQNYIADNALQLFTPVGWGDLAVAKNLGGVAQNFTGTGWRVEYWYRTGS